MGLSCECDYDDPAWFYAPPDDYTRLDTRRARRCSSCGALIRRGALCTEFVRWRAPRWDVEERIYGEEVPLASKRLCEGCSDTWFNLEALGFHCVGPDDDMREMLRQYVELSRERRASAREARL